MKLYQNEKFCTIKETITRMIWQSTERKKIFPNHISGKGLIFKIYRELLQFNSKNIKSNFKMGKVNK